MAQTTPTTMFEITVETEFCAAHALLISGIREARHGHNFRVRVTVSGAQLDSDGLLCDFHLVKEVLEEIVSPLSSVDLNETPPFDRVNPSAEEIARHIGDTMAERLDEGLSPHARVDRVEVTESTRCWATYRR
jgi:6-pyruvoyltetrahydropterin/6-carboxytetrahydropterin synthase